jgi:hypothetical protein
MKPEYTNNEVLKWGEHMMTKKYIKAFLILWAGFLTAILSLLGVYMVSKITNETNYTNALIENTGKPQIIEQRYYSPQK